MNLNFSRFSDNDIEIPLDKPKKFRLRLDPPLNSLMTSTKKATTDWKEFIDVKIVKAEDKITDLALDNLRKSISLESDSIMILELTLDKEVQKIEINIKKSFIFYSPKNITLHQTNPLIYEAKILAVSELVVGTTASQAVIGGTIGSAAAITVISGAGSSSLVYLIKLFQILDILGNLSKINIPFGSGLQKTFDFVNNLRVPKIGFLEKLSPITDNDIVYFRRGERGKLA